MNIRCDFRLILVLFYNLFCFCFLCLISFAASMVGYEYKVLICILSASMYFNYQEYSLPRQTLFGQSGGGSDGGSGGDAVGQHHRHPS